MLQFLQRGFKRSGVTERRPMESKHFPEPKLQLEKTVGRDRKAIIVRTPRGRFSLDQATEMQLRRRQILQPSPRCTPEE
jgi:hypothetical protein